MNKKYYNLLVVDLVVYGMLLYLLLSLQVQPCNHFDWEHESETFHYLGCVGHSDLPILEQELFVTLSKG